MQYGTFMVLDEKLKHFTGASPCSRQILSKPDKIGHWVSEVCVYIARDIPYCTRLFPITTCTTAGETTPVSDIVAWATMGIPKFPNGTIPTIVADAYYLDTTGRDLLLRQGTNFICAVNPVRFKVQTDTLREIVKGTTGEWAAMRNTTTGELFLHVHDKNRGPKYVLTNCFRPTTKKLQKGKIPVWDEYWYGASACDRFNAQMGKHYWPFKRTRWEHGIDDLLFTVTMFDIFNIHRVVNPGIHILTEKMRELAFDLYKHALTL